MRGVISVAAFIQAVEARKRALGVTDEIIDAARNSGRRRTPEKRRQLAEMQDRARKAGQKPLAANF